MGCKLQQQQQSSQELLLRLVLLGIVLLLAPRPAQSQHLYKQTISQTILDMRSSIVQALGLSQLPDLAKANVSQAEYERAHNEYLSKLEQSVPLHDREAAYQRILFTLRPIGMEWRAAEGTRVLLRFRKRNESPSEGNCSTESRLLRLLLQHDGHSAKKLELQVRLGDKAEKPLARLQLMGLGPRRARWLELELPAEELELRRGELQLRVELSAAGQGARRPALSISEAALNLHLVCARARPRTRKRARRSPRRNELWSMHRGRRSECRSVQPADAKKCCRHEMSVNFKELEGFDFIIQPKSFDAGFCKGRCPPRYNPAHHHALLQSLIWKGDRSKAPRPCCAPSKLAELEILYFDEAEPTKLKVSNWKDMRALECACS